MVALKDSFVPGKETLHVKIRVGDFFWQTSNYVGENRLASRMASGKNEWFVYDERWGSSLAQGGERGKSHRVEFVSLDEKMLEVARKEGIKIRKLK